MMAWLVWLACAYNVIKESGRFRAAIQTFKIYVVLYALRIQQIQDIFFHICYVMCVYV